MTSEENFASGQIFLTAINYLNLSLHQNDGKLVVIATLSGLFSL